MYKFEQTYFAVTVHVWRKKSELTLREVEELTNIPIATLSRIEADERCPTILELVRLCNWMDENPATFFRDESKGKNRV